MKKPAKKMMSHSKEEMKEMKTGKYTGAHKEKMAAIKKYKNGGMVTKGKC